ncbi:MAG: hypothetical protein AAFZ15_03355 [Bacteroidota bacterium]
MPNLNQIKKELKLTTTNIDSILKRLDSLLDINKQNTFNIFAGFRFRHKQWKLDKLSGTSSHKSLKRESNQILQGLLNFIDLLDEKDLKPGFNLMEEIPEKILVVCKTEARLKYLNNLLPEEYFVNVEYAAPGSQHEAEGIEIIIFDNDPYDDDGGQHQLIKYYLEKTDPVLLYFGKTLKFLHDYPEKAYFSNSIFSIHARINEMIGFLKYQKAAKAKLIE